MSARQSSTRARHSRPHVSHERGRTPARPCKTRALVALTHRHTPAFVLPAHVSRDLRRLHERRAWRCADIVRALSSLPGRQKGATGPATHVQARIRPTAMSKALARPDGVLPYWVIVLAASVVFWWALKSERMEFRAGPSQTVARPIERSGRSRSHSPSGAGQTLPGGDDHRRPHADRRSLTLLARRSHPGTAGRAI